MAQTERDGAEKTDGDARMPRERPLQALRAAAAPWRHDS